MHSVQGSCDYKSCLEQSWVSVTVYMHCLHDKKNDKRIVLVSASEVSVMLIGLCFYFYLFCISVIPFYAFKLVEQSTPDSDRCASVAVAMVATTRVIFA